MSLINGQRDSEISTGQLPNKPKTAENRLAQDIQQKFYLQVHSR